MLMVVQTLQVEKQFFLLLQFQILLLEELY